MRQVGYADSLLDTPLSALGAVLRGIRYYSSIPLDQSLRCGEKRRECSCRCFEKRLCCCHKTRHRNLSHSFETADGGSCVRRSVLCSHFLRGIGHVPSLSLRRIFWIVRSSLRGGCRV